MIAWLAFCLAGSATAFDAAAKRKPLEPNGRPVTAAVFVRLGAPLQAELDGRWYAAQAIGLLDDGMVKIHWVGLSSQADEVLPRARLMFADDPLAGQLANVQANAATVVKLKPEPVVPAPAPPKQASQVPQPAPKANRTARPPRSTMADMTPEQLVEVVEKGEHFSVRDALKELESRRPDEPNPAVSKALEKLVLGSDFSMAWAAAKPWEHWATKESVPGLIKAMDDKASFVTEPTARALARLQPDEAIDRLVAALGELGKHDEATTALVAYGLRAEPALLEMIVRKATPNPSQDNFTVDRACKILGEIGTQRSLPVLTALTGNFFNRREANAAIQAIQSRPAKAPPKTTTKNKGK